MKTTSVKTLIQERNRIDSEIIAIESGIKDENTKILIKEILNLQNGVGAGFVESWEYDHYVPCRYYSQIAGVKNIRFGFDHKIVVKVTSPIGYLLPV